MRVFSKPLSLWGVFQNSSPCEGLFKTPLSVKGFSNFLCLWRVFQNSSPCEGFSKQLALWLVFQHPSPCDGFHSLKCSDLDFKKNCEFLDAEAQFWNASGALFRIDFSAAVLLSLSKYVCMHVWRHTYPGFALLTNKYSSEQAAILLKQNAYF